MRNSSGRLRLVPLAAGFSVAMLAAATLLPGAASAQSRQPARPATTRSVDNGGAKTRPVPAKATPAAVPTRAVCPRPVTPGTFSCASLQVTSVASRRTLAAGTAPPGFGPADLASAYALPSAPPQAGETVAIVDAYDNPNAESDLAIYRSQYGLPACTSASGCFRKVAQDGSTNYPAPDADWAEEESLDVDMVSAVCPACKILLVEADSNTTDNLGVSVNEAVSLGAKFVSNSYGAAEDPSDLTADSQYFDHPGVVLTAASGDWGYGAYYPAASPYVTSVGGTSLVKDTTSARGWSETVWSSAGSGCSAIEPKPSWQTDDGCKNRTIADVSAVADPATAVAIYDSGAGGWVEVGGTSVSSPIIAAAYALAGEPKSGENPAEYPYEHYLADGSDLNDVTSGSDGTCTPGYLCTAGPGYDGPTGVGTLNGVSALTSDPFGKLAGTVTDASTGKPVAGAEVSVSPRLAAVTDAQGTYRLSVPAGSYTMTVSLFGYATDSVHDVAVTGDGTTTKDAVLTPAPHEAVTGTITDGGGQGWPLYAKITATPDGPTDGPAPTLTAYSTPASGAYRLDLPADAGYTLRVTSVYPGYPAVSSQLKVGDAAITHDQALRPSAACTAPGYQPAYSGGSFQRFGSGQLPAGWHVRNVDPHYPGYTASPGWVFTNPGHRANHTGGSGGFAIVDSDYYGPHHYQDTRLITPVVNLAHAKTPVVQFNADLNGAVNSTATVAVSLDGGKSWQRVWASSGVKGAPGPRLYDIAVPQAAGKTSVQARFRYVGSWSGWWSVDDVFLGNRTCAAVAGGLLTGRVTAAGAAVDGAVVTSVSNPGSHAVTVATPGDSAIGGGLYWLFVPAGTQEFTATMSGYATQTATATIKAGAIASLNFALAAS